MMGDKTYKVKVWGHNDAVVFVYEHRHKKINPKDKDCIKHKHWQEAVYVHDTDNSDMGIAYTINYRRQFVNA